MAAKITAKELMSQKNDFVIIDVREIDELKGGIIEDSVHMPLGLSTRNAKKRIEDIQNKICTYCSSRYRGNTLADEFTKEGFYAITFDGGYSSWL